MTDEPLQLTMDGDAVPHRKVVEQMDDGKKRPLKVERKREMVETTEADTEQTDYEGEPADREVETDEKPAQK